MLSLSAIVRNDQVRRKDDQSALHTSSLDQASVDQSKLSENAENNMVNSDLWSEAFREAVENLGKDYVAILEGRNVKQLFEQPEKDDKEAAQESAFIRGLETLRSIVPLEKFKLALDLATPLTSIEPAVATVFGVVRIVTAVSWKLINTHFPDSMSVWFTEQDFHRLPLALQTPTLNLRGRLDECWHSFHISMIATRWANRETRGIYTR